MTGQPTPTRATTLIAHAHTYRIRSGVSHERWAEDVARAYCQLVPEGHRSVPAPDLDGLDSAREYMRQLRAWDQQLRRYADDRNRLPADLEEAWVQALGEPYRTQCLHELAERHGLYAALKGSEGAVGDHECWARTTRRWSELTRLMGRILTQGEIGGDQESVEALIQEADAMRGDLTSLIERGRSALEQDQQRPLRSVS